MIRNVGSNPATLWSVTNQGSRKQTASLNPVQGTNEPIVLGTAPRALYILFAPP